MKYLPILLALLFAAPAWGDRGRWPADHIRMPFDDVEIEGILDLGTADTFTEFDATPDVSGGVVFDTHTSADAITFFDGGATGQKIVVVTRTTKPYSTTYNCSGPNLVCGTVDLKTYDEDVTVWQFDGSAWLLRGYIDNNRDNNAGIFYPSAGDQAIPGFVYFQDFVSFEETIDLGSFDSFEGDFSPTVNASALYHADQAGLITTFNSMLDGQIIIVRTTVDGVNFRCDDTSLRCGTVNLSTDANDVTMWLKMGGKVTLLGIFDASQNMNYTAGGGGGDVSTDTIWDTKGDIVAATGPDVATKLAVGANGEALVAASGEATGLDWVDVATQAEHDAEDECSEISGCIETEGVEDLYGAAVSGNTETRITATYDDADGTLDLVVDDMNDDVPESGDFGAGVDLEADGSLSDDTVGIDELSPCPTGTKVVKHTGGTPTCEDAVETTIDAPTDGEMLLYDETEQDWQNQPLSGDATMDETGAVVVADDSHEHADGCIIKFETATEDSDFMCGKANVNLQLDDFNCVATGAATPSSHVATVVECTSAGASCTSSGGTITASAKETNYNDSTFGTDAYINSGNWWGIETTGAPGTAATILSCQVDFTRGVTIAVVYTEDCTTLPGPWTDASEAGAGWAVDTARCEAQITNPPGTGYEVSSMVQGPTGTSNLFCSFDAAAVWSTSSKIGCIFRAAGSPGDHYVVWWNQLNNDYEFINHDGDDASKHLLVDEVNGDDDCGCTYVVDLADTDIAGITVTGTGASTAVSWWIDIADEPGYDVQDPTTWGTATCECSAAEVAAHSFTEIDAAGKCGPEATSTDHPSTEPKIDDFACGDYTP